MRLTRVAKLNVGVFATMLSELWPDLLHRSTAPLSTRHPSSGQSVSWRALNKLKRLAVSDKPSQSMADDMEQKTAEELEAEAQAAEEARIAAESSSTEDNPEDETDYKALAEAEKQRADAAEALIIKNKQIDKRHEKKDEAPGLSEERVLELIKAAQKEDESPEAKQLREAQEKVKLLEAQRAEAIRAAKARARGGGGGEHRDGDTAVKPKLPDNSPLKDFEWRGGDLYAKKLSSGKTMFRRAQPRPGEKHSWVE
mgnify:CR=1 FL=1